MMLDFSKIADRVKDVDKNRFADLKKETEIKLKMIDVVERLSKKYASGLDKKLPSLQKFNENYKTVCKMIENKEITEINDDEDFLKRLVDDDKK